MNSELEKAFDALMGSDPPATAAAMRLKVEIAKREAELGRGRIRPPDLYEGSYGQIRQAVMPRLPSLHDMLCMRMRWHGVEGARSGFDHVAVHSAGDKVFVWVITKDTQTVTMEDDGALFPSDALITKLRLLQQEK